MIHRAGGLSIDLCSNIDRAALVDNPGYSLDVVEGSYETPKWRQVFVVDTSEYSYGHLMIAGEINVSVDGSTFYDLNVVAPLTYNLMIDNVPMIEARVIVWHGMISQIWFEGALGNRANAQIGGADKSPGPIYLPFPLGEVPDRIEVLARVFRPKTSGVMLYPDERITITPISRFVSGALVQA